MKKINSVFRVFLIFSLMILFFNNCNKKTTSDVETNYTIEIAKVISQATSGIIPPDVPVIVRFVSPVVDKTETGKSIDADIFEFDPKIKGNLQWKDSRTLEFKPNESLPLKQDYIAKLHLDNLLDLSRYPDLKATEFNFNFKTSGRELVEVKGDFYLTAENIPDKVFYQGNITFNVPTDPETLKDSINMVMGNNDLPLEFETLENSTRFNFKSGVITRDKEQKTISFRVAGKPLEIQEDYRKSVNLESIDTMKAFDFNVIKGEKQLGFEISFTDEISSEQDVNGFVGIQPNVNLQLKVSGKKIIVLGDFKHGKSYIVKIQPGITSRWGTKTTQEYKRAVSFDDMNPEISFSNDGVFLPSTNQQKIYFKTMNLSSAKLQIKKVFESNLGQFLQTEQLNSPKNRNSYFDSYYIERIGVTVAEQDLDIGQKKNIWLQHELDLKKIIKPGEKGLFLISLSFEKKDMLYIFSEETYTYDGDDYYNNPNSEGYFYSRNTVNKALIMSDIALTFKNGYNRQIVYANDIITAKPLSGVNVTLRTFQNQIISQKETDGDGKAVFENIKEEVFYVEGEANSQRSVVQINEMGWNLSTFDTGGEELVAEGTRATIYTERGVYRPGDTINLSVIARNENNTFPENHPVTLKIYNPKEQLVYEMINKDGKDGFYNFVFKTNENDMTGNWGAEILAGSRTFNHLIKIETVIPNRLKVKIEPEKTKLKSDDKILKINFSSKYLFGNPASKLDSEVSATFQSKKNEFNTFPGFTFYNEAIDYKEQTFEIFKGSLDEEGKKYIQYNLPSFKGVPGSIEAHLTGRVIEKGGRDTKNDSIIPISPYRYYVGLKKPDFDYGYVKVGDEVQIDAVLVDENGISVPYKKMKYRIYKNNRHWWWEYDNQNSYRLHFKNDIETELIKEGTLVSQNKPVNIPFNADQRGEYFIEIQAGENEDGHSAGFFFSASYWGDTVSGMKNEGTLVLKSDKKIYHPGETAVVSFPAPEKAEYLISVEKGNKILQTFWHRQKTVDGEAKVSISVTEEMIPNSYFTVSVMQPHEQTGNDRPMRMYGILPVNVEDPLTHQEIEIKMPSELKAKKPFDVEIQTKDNKQTQYTIAVVDEGLLDLTNFATPDPWKEFHKKIRLGVSTFDLFSYIIGVNKGDIFKTFSVGGDLDYRVNQDEMKKAKRFKLVSMFKGPLMTDENGNAKVSFEMPEYLGSVRVMVIAAKGNRYASAEKAVPVKSELMILPTIPRVLGSGDSIILPVTVFTTKDNIRDVKVSIKTEGPLNVTDEKIKSLIFSKSGDQDVYFKLSAKPAAGIAKIIITGISGSIQESNTTEISVRPSSPRISDVEEKEAGIAQTVSLLVPKRGIDGSNHSSVTISRKKKLNISNRMEWLTNYPYGCIEQTTSSVFPQLFLKEFVKTTDKGSKKIDDNINAAIKMLRKFQLGNGAFSYWPGQSEPSVWGTNYAGHFMVEASKLGYNIPDDLFDNWLKFQKNQSRYLEDNLISKTYRVYILALAGQPEFGAMNLLKENELSKMNDTEKWLLAGSYKLAGIELTAKQIISEAGINVKDYEELSNTYGSGLRDKAIILEMLTLFKKWDLADKVYDQLVDKMASEEWYSTQTTGYLLMALGKYMKENNADFASVNPLLSGNIILPDGKKVDFSTKQAKYTYDINDGFEGKNIKVNIDKNTTVKRSFVSMEWNGIPLNPDVKDINQNLNLIVEWLDNNGNPLKIDSIKQGTSFWGHFRVENISGMNLSELALVQIFPAGWEIENSRISKDDSPQWISKYKIYREKYFDIRDDRIMWFFDLPAYEKSYDFVVKINAITKGEFILPPTITEAMYSKNFKAVRTGRKVLVN